MFEEKILRLLGPKAELVIEAGGNCILSKYIMDSPAVEQLDYIWVVKSSKGVAYVTCKCINLDICTKTSKKILEQPCKNRYT
jgi:hypothetical protein